MITIGFESSQLLEHDCNKIHSVFRGNWNVGVAVEKAVGQTSQGNAWEGGPWRAERRDAACAILLFLEPRQPTSLCRGRKQHYDPSVTKKCTYSWFSPTRLASSHQAGKGSGQMEQEALLTRHAAQDRWRPKRPCSKKGKSPADSLAGLQIKRQEVAPASSSSREEWSSG